MKNSHIEQISDGFITDFFLVHNEKNNIFQAQCHIEISNYHLSLFQQLNIELPSNIEKSSKKRQAQFLAGRFVAKQAIAHSNLLSNEKYSIPIGENRNPIWPKGIIGSISHTSGFVVSIITAQISNLSQQKNNYIGIDAEKYIYSKTAKEITSTVINDREISLSRNIDIDFNYFLTLCFSAKESLFKALYPIINEFFSFQKAEIIAINVKKRKLSIKLNENLALSHKVQSVYECYYEFYDNFLITKIFNS